MRTRAGLVGAVLALLPTGCGLKTAPVSGRVTLDGKPLANATVVFVPEADGAGKDAKPSSVGTTDANGHYSLELDRPDKTPGAVVGKHRVLITLGAKPGPGDGPPAYHQQLPPRYNRKSTLECEVPAGGRANANFDLKSD